MKDSPFLCSEAIGRESFKLNPSPIGTDDYAKCARRYVELEKISPEFLFSTLAKRLTKPFDCYITNFVRIDIQKISESVPTLIKEFGTQRLYSAAFLKTFDNVRRLSYNRVMNACRVREALEQAIAQGLRISSGFLAISVEGNQYRPKDILLWNHLEGKWTSFNRSRTEILRAHKKEMLQNFVEVNDYWAHCLETKGAVVRPNQYEDANFIRVTSDGLIWYEYTLAESIGQNIWEVWNEGWEIKHDRHKHTAKFRAVKGGKWYSNRENAATALQAVRFGYEVVEVSPEKIAFRVNPEDFPHLYVREPDGSLEQFEYLKNSDYFTDGAVTFLNGLRKLVEEEQKTNPGEKLIFLRDIAEKGWFGDVSNCIAKE